MKVFLTTERLRLRRITLEDAPLVFAMDSDPEVIRYTDLGGCGLQETYRETILPRWLRYYEEYDARGYWIAEETATDRFLGWFHFRPPRNTPAGTLAEAELGYRLRRSAWGRGYASEMARELVQRGDDLGAERITATALAANGASIRVMQKAGLRFEADRVYEFTDANTNLTTAYPAVRYGLNRAERQKEK